VCAKFQLDTLSLLGCSPVKEEQQQQEQVEKLEK